MAKKKTTCPNEPRRRKEIELKEYIESHAGKDWRYFSDEEIKVPSNWWGIGVKLRTPISVGGMRLLEDICIAVPDSGSKLMSKCDFLRTKEDEWIRGGRYAVVINMESKGSTPKEALILKRQYFPYLLDRLRNEGIGIYQYESFYAPSGNVGNEDGKRYILKIFFGPCKTMDDVVLCCKRVADFIYSPENMPSESELNRYKPVTVKQNTENKNNTTP